MKDVRLIGTSLACAFLLGIVVSLVWLDGGQAQAAGDRFVGRLARLGLRFMFLSEPYPTVEDKEPQPAMYRLGSDGYAILNHGRSL